MYAHCAQPRRGSAPSIQGHAHPLAGLLLLEARGPELHKVDHYGRPGLPSSRPCFRSTDLWVMSPTRLPLHQSAMYAHCICWRQTSIRSLRYCFAPALLVISPRSPAIIRKRTGQVHTVAGSLLHEAWRPECHEIGHNGRPELPSSRPWFRSTDLWVMSTTR